MRYSRNYTLKDRVLVHINQYLIYYLIGVFSICVGMVIGIYTAKYMTSEYRDGLVEVIHRNGSILNDGSVTTMGYFLRTVKDNMFMLLILFILGLSVIGTPLVYLVDAYKGFSVGFSFAFMVNTFGNRGIWVALVGLVLFNLIYIPLILFASILAIENSLDIINNGLNRNRNWLNAVMKYISGYIVVTVIVIATNLIQCFLYPLLLSGI